MENFDGALGRIEADAIGQATVAVGVVGQNQGNAAIAHGGAAQAGPLGGQVRDKLNAIAHRLVGHHIGF